MINSRMFTTVSASGRNYAAPRTLELDTGSKYPETVRRAYGVVVSRFVRNEKASGSIPDMSTFMH